MTIATEYLHNFFFVWFVKRLYIKPFKDIFYSAFLFFVKDDHGCYKNNGKKDGSRKKKYNMHLKTIKFTHYKR